MTVTRNVPKVLRDALCREVGFACPISDCGVPYLTIHHFDPPWSKGHVHNPDGMIALCSNHAAKADGGYYQDDHLRRLKADSTARTRRVKGEFDFLRHEMIAVIGGNAYYRTPVPLVVDDEPWVWFNRDEDGYLLLNVRFPGPGNHTRAHLEDNVWVVEPPAASIECPPRGRSLKVEFPNGDRFQVKFREVTNLPALIHEVPWILPAFTPVIDFPVTVARFWERVQGAEVELTPDGTRVGSSHIRNTFSVSCNYGLAINSSLHALPGTTPAGALAPETKDLLLGEMRRIQSVRRRP